MRENGKALCDVTRKIIQDEINWRSIRITLKSAESVKTRLS
jgi:hypothetical protein